MYANGYPEVEQYQLNELINKGSCNWESMREISDQVEQNYSTLRDINF